MPEITQEGHADTLAYGWWESKRGHVLLPRTLNHKNNYVLSHEELAAYDAILVEFKQQIEREQARVAVTLTVLNKGRVHSWERETPTCFSLAHILEFLVKLGKHKLTMMQFLCFTTKRFNDERAHQAAAAQDGNQAPQVPGSPNHQADACDP